MQRRTRKRALLSFIDKIFEDNLFLLSSSVSYYSALAIAPFLLIILWGASIVGANIQQKIVFFVFDFSPEISDIIKVIFENVNEGFQLGTLSGAIGAGAVLWSASLVFLQLRYSFDTIYQNKPQTQAFSILDYVKERIFAMVIVIISGLFLVASSFLPKVLKFIVGGNEKMPLYQALAQGLNIFIYVLIFWGILYLTPTKKPGLKGAFKGAILSSVLFLIGNYFLGMYLRGIASSSIYGAAGSLLIFLIWVYYSAFTLFLSAEVIFFLRKIKS